MKRANISNASPGKVPIRTPREPFSGPMHIGPHHPPAGWPDMGPTRTAFVNLPKGTKTMKVSPLTSVHYHSSV